MQILSNDLDLRCYFDTLKRADWRVLLLDYDGTLAPFRVDRGKALPYPHVRELLVEILQLPRTRTVIVSGRSVKDLTELISVSPLPELWGSHGWERLGPEANYSMFPLDEDSRRTLSQGHKILSSLGYSDRSETKPAGIAVHWRGLSLGEADLIRTRVLSEWSLLVEGSQLEVHFFDGGIELRPKGRNKGSAVNEILSEVNGTIVSAYLGDDVTDEDAFKAMAGRGLRVLVRESYRETSADLWIRPPHELLSFLNQWKHACAVLNPNG